MESRRAIRFAVLLVASLCACDRQDDEPTEDVGAPGCVASLALSTLSTCVQFDNGEVSCVGWNHCGELGDGAASGSRAHPEPIVGLSDVRKLSGGSWGFCAVSADATGWCWGANPDERLGNPATEPTCGEKGPLVAEPTRTLDLVGVTDIDLGSRHACAVLEDGSVGCWGDNSEHQLGGGTEETMSSSLVPVDLAPAREIRAGYQGNCALLADATVSCWGYIPGVLDSPATPTDAGLTGITQLAVHGNTYYALGADGTVWAWGANEDGQLGIGTEGGGAGPVHIDSLSDVVQIAAGGSHACAVLGNGEVWCWGANFNSQIALPGAAPSSLPVRFQGVPLAAAISSGQEHTCIVARDGSVHCWGCNCCYQLGSGPKVQCAPDGSGSGAVLADFECPPTDPQTSFYGCAAASGDGPAGIAIGALTVALLWARRRRAPVLQPSGWYSPGDGR
jgi:MYXO-CTERM domain-containing protein